MRTSGGSRTHVAHHQGHRFFLARGVFWPIRAFAKLALETKDAKLTPAGRELRGRNLLH